MSKILIISEKPSHAAEMRSMLSATEKQDWTKNNGYFESEKYLCSWFFGHLLEAKKPGECDAKYEVWSMDTLPIEMDRLQYKYKEAQGERGGTQGQGKLLAKLARDAQYIVCSTDPDREGEGIFRIWYNFENITIPVKRFWSTSLTEKDLAKAWSTMRDSAQYDNFARAQEIRSLSDWLVGMNACRAYSVSAGTTFRIGRVLTATLALVVERDRQVENYKESFTYSLRGLWNGIRFTYYDNENTSKFETKAPLESLLKGIEKKPFHVCSMEKKNRIENPPETFSMPSLQKEANKRLGFTLDKTLALTQQLYEKKLVSYPRTDSPCLPESDLQEYYELVQKLASPKEKELLRVYPDKPPCVKNTEAPHTAIIPTGKQEALSGDEQALYELIKDRFVTAFMQPRCYDEYSIDIVDDEKTLVMRGKVCTTVDPGFSALVKQSNEDEENENEEQQEIGYINEQKLREDKKPFEQLEVAAIKAAKPKYFTPATLLTAMINAGRKLEDQKQRDALREVDGLGTSATRDTFPKELIKSGYLQEQGNTLRSSPKGRMLIDWVHPKLSTPQLTAEWEIKLKKIEQGQYASAQYLQELKAFIREIITMDTAKIEKFKQGIEQEQKTEYVCPKCSKKNLFKSKFGLSCDKECGFQMYTEICGKVLSDAQLKKLFTDKKTDVIQGFKPKEKDKPAFAARLVLTDDFKLQFSREMDELRCPKCDKNLSVISKGYVCSRECGFAVWNMFAGKKLSNKVLEKLISDGVTPKIKGFLSAKNGKEFDAAIHLDDDFKMRFKFD